jgi:hypothetical protein
VSHDLPVAVKHLLGLEASYEANYASLQAGELVKIQDVLLRLRDWLARSEESQQTRGRSSWPWICYHLPTERDRPVWTAQT